MQLLISSPTLVSLFLLLKAVLKVKFSVRGDQNIAKATITELPQKYIFDGLLLENFEYIL